MPVSIEHLRVARELLEYRSRSNLADFITEEHVNILNKYADLQPTDPSRLSHSFPVEWAERKFSARTALRNWLAQDATLYPRLHDTIANEQIQQDIVLNELRKEVSDPTNSGPSDSPGERAALEDANLERETAFYTNILSPIRQPPSFEAFRPPQNPSSNRSGNTAQMARSQAGALQEKNKQKEEEQGEQEGEIPQQTERVGNSSPAQLAAAMDHLTRILVIRQGQKNESIEAFCRKN